MGNKEVGDEEDGEVKNSKLNLKGSNNIVGI
jgi:hypothetical protein